MPVRAIRNNFPFKEGNSILRQDIFINKRLVESSNVEWVAWPVTGEPTMIVQYRGGDVYAYLGVSRQRIVAAAYAESTGKYINEKIKPHFRMVKLIT